MNTKPDDGGPAFPREDYQADDAPGQRGMSLRDYMAAKAMAAMIATYPCQAIDTADGGIQVSMQALAEDAYDMADEMLKARQH